MEFRRVLFRSLLPRQRRRLDSRTRSWPRHSMAGQLFELAGAERQPPADRAEAGRRALQGDEGRTGMEIGRASWRERGGQYVEYSEVAGSLKKKGKQDSEVR